MGDRFKNPVQRYLHMLDKWRTIGMPSSMLDMLDALWKEMTPAEKNMAMLWLAAGLRDGKSNNNSDDNP